MSTPKKLVVVVCGFACPASAWTPLLERLKAEPGWGTDEVDWMPPFELGVGRLSRVPIDRIASVLQAKIGARLLLHPSIEEIVLVGHSMGGLVARQAYLRAAGAIADVEPSVWAKRVRRIVLFASVNRGIRWKKIPVPIRFLHWLCRRLHIFRKLTVLDAFAGSTFLTNLRIAWIRHFVGLGEDSPREVADPALPFVVQVLGTEDSLVSPEDSRDVLAFPGSATLPVPGANHKDLHRLDVGKDSDEKYAVLREAFVSPPSVAARAPSGVKRVVFLLHGIRASNVADWQDGVARALKAQAGAEVEVVRPTYGYFTALRFALPHVRRRNIPFLQDLYAEALATHPGATFSVLAHSNGTYILGNSLSRIPAMRFAEVALAGSVLPTTFEWPTIKGRNQATRILNERANRDWPVALLCNGLRGLRSSDVGTGGFEGFHGAVTMELAYHQGDHGAALAPANHARLAAYLLGQSPTHPDLPDNPGYFRFLSNLSRYLVPALALGVLVGLGWLLFTDHWMAAAVTVGALYLVYIVLDTI